MPHILVTNDDGYQAPALTILARALRRVGEVTVFAPDHNWSAAGHTKTMHKPLRITKSVLVDDIPLFVTTGTPSDCVALALLGVVPTPFDLVVSGINHGANLGHDITYSGTVAGAMEGAVAGRPAIAASMEYTGDSAAGGGKAGDLEFAAEFVAELSRQVLESGLPRYGLLNVNFPALPRPEITGVRLTRLGIRVYHDTLIERLDPKGRPYYWIGGEPPTGEPEEGTDVGALACGNISITPLNLDMTDHGQLARLSQWPLQWVQQSGGAP